MCTTRLEVSRRIFDQPMFVDSRRYRTLKLADLVAYTTYRIIKTNPESLEKHSTSRNDSMN